MKKLYMIIGAICMACGISSCSDMLETESSRQLFDPELNEKTDTIFYALGILQGMQELADHYVFQGEMRGDLVKTTTYTDNNLRQLHDFSATTANKYDSAYVYYRVINNCNYYIAHVDTTLSTGADYVMMNEYVAVKAIRAWTYLQLARVYGKVPFYTEPLTQISQIDNSNYPELGMEELVRILSADLEQYTQGSKVYNTPNYGGTPSYASFSPAYIFMPVEVVLGEMYLETGQYDKAAQQYVRYLTQVTSAPYSPWRQFYTSRGRNALTSELPSDYDSSNNSPNNVAYGGLWGSIFSSTLDYITYIPMPTSSLQGTTTALPVTFGYDLYATDKSGENRYIDEVQLVASDSYLNLVNAQDFYYYSTTSTASNPVIKKTKVGDMRYRGITHEREDSESDSTMVWITKFNAARIPLFRTSTVLLHLAEAFNRLGMPDAAFSILKDGINEYIVTVSPSMSEESKTALKTTYPLLSEAYKSRFENSYCAFGIHQHGSGLPGDYLNGVWRPGLTDYQYETVVGDKLQEIAETFNLQVGTTKQDTINAMEDILCDEYALEFSFEGCRYNDLLRMARHKNGNSPDGYPANFGYTWMKKKLEGRNWDESKMYLPFK